MNDQPAFRDQLRDSLLSAARRRRRAKRLRRLTGLAGVAMVATMVALVGTQARSPSSDASVLTIVREGDGIQVTLDDLQAKPEEIKAELEDAGLSANVEEMPVSPSTVGKFIFRGGAEVTTLDGGPQGFRSFVVKNDVQQVSLYFGRPAEGEEPYFQSVSAFQTGEPLHCSGMDRLDPVEADEKLRERGFEVRWQRYISSGVTDTSAASERGSKIISILHTADHELLAYVAAPDDQHLSLLVNDDDCAG